MSKTVLYPLIVRHGPRSLCRSNNTAQCVIAVKQDDRIFYPVAEFLQRQEFNVNMQQGIVVQANQNPWLTNMLAGEPVYKVPKRLCIGSHFGDVIRNLISRDRIKSTSENSSTSLVMKEPAKASPITPGRL